METTQLDEIPSTASILRPGPRAQLDTNARLMLAAALLDSNFEEDGKLATDSAIFTPYRNYDEQQEQLYDDAQHYEHGQADYQPQYESPAEENRLSVSHDGDMALQWNTRASRQLASPSPSGRPLASRQSSYLQSASLPTAAAISPEALDIPDSDLASQWGLDDVMTKFEREVFQEETPKKSKRKKRPRRGTAHTDTDILAMSTIIDAIDVGDTSTTSLGDSFGTTPRTTRKRAATVGEADVSSRMLGVSLDISCAGGSLSDALQDSSEPAQTFKRQRTPSLGFLDEDPANTTQEEAEAFRERPATSMSVYTSRFDPRAVSAAKEEQISSKLRFPNSVHPKVLVMPAPLADIVAYEEEQRRLVEESERLRQAELNKPRPEREAGKLYGRSLMDELSNRKHRQKARNKTFTGDARRAMMDDPGRTLRPSPLSHPLSPDGSREHDPLGSAGSKVAMNGEKDELEADPWRRFATKRALTASISIPTGGLDASQSPERGKLTPLGFGGQLSTKELQTQYKRASRLSLSPNMAAKADSDDSADDDVPLQHRQKRLTTLATLQGSTSSNAIAQSQAQDGPVNQSVFGQDLVMQRELAKLQKILALEEAERKIAMEKQRVIDAEKAAKDAKKRAKEEKRARKRRDKAGSQTFVVNDSVQQRASHAAQHSLDWSGREDGRSAAVEALAPSATAQYRQSSFSVLRPPSQQFAEHVAPVEGDDDDLWNTRRDTYIETSIASLPDITPSLSLAFESSSLLDDGLLSQKPSKQKQKGSGSRHQRVKSRQGSLLDWAADDGASIKSNDSQKKRNKARSTSRIGGVVIEDHASLHNSDEQADFSPAAAAPVDIRELDQIDEGEGFGSLLDQFAAVNDEDKEDTKRSRCGKAQIANNDDDDELSPLSRVAARRSAQVLHPVARVTMNAPRLDIGNGGLGFDGLLSPSRPKQASRVKARPLSDASSHSTVTNEEDDTPLAVQKMQAAVNAANAAKGKHLSLNIGLDLGPKATEGEDSDSDEDSVPLAMRQADNAPLGQLHPTGGHALAMHYQAEQNFQMMQQLQAQYESQYHARMQMQLQQAALHQAALQGHITASEVGYAAPPSAMSWGGAASDIGLNLPPDPKLVSSVDRWRQNVV